jgi:EAL domain-containing protein (putative c-di-GMP-specific phosphodiesterase class I)
MLQAIRAYTFKWEQWSFPLAFHFGLVVCPAGETDSQLLLKNADSACMAAKNKGVNLIQRYEDDDKSLETQKRLLTWAGKIDQVINGDRLFVRCQKIAPIFPERDSHSHYEILLGILDEAGNVMPPFEFITAAEHWGRISEIDRWQVKSVLNWIRQNRTRFTKIEGFSINLSGQSINSEEFLAFLHEEFSDYNLPVEKITFEITETAALGEFNQTEKFIRQIKRYGCKFSLDDFGSGYSSYAYLKNLQVDYLKIDGSFVKDLVSNTNDQAMVKSMNEVGHSLGMKTIAEYVENDEILQILRDIGVDYAQGYGIAKPCRIEDLSET